MKSSKQIKESIVQSINTNLRRFLPARSFRSRAGIKNQRYNKLVRDIIKTVSIKDPESVIQRRKGKNIQYKVMRPLNMEDDVKGYSKFLKEARNHGIITSYSKMKKEDVRRYINKHLGELITATSIYEEIGKYPPSGSSITAMLKSLRKIAPDYMEVTHTHDGTYVYTFTKKLPYQCLEEYKDIAKEENPEKIKEYREKYILNYAPVPEVPEEDEEYILRFTIHGVNIDKIEPLTESYLDKCHEGTDIHAIDEGIIETTAIAVSIIINDNISWNDLEEEERNNIIKRVKHLLVHGVHPAEVIDYSRFIKKLSSLS